MEASGIVHLPKQEKDWRARIVSNIQKIVPGHTTEHATPPAEQDNIEFPSINDATRNIGAIVHEEGTEKHSGTISNLNFASRVRNRARRMMRLSKAA